MKWNEMSGLRTLNDATIISITYNVNKFTKIVINNHSYSIIIVVVGEKESICGKKVEKKSEIHSLIHVNNNNVTDSIDRVNNGISFHLQWTNNNRHVGWNNGDLVMEKWKNKFIFRKIKTNAQHNWIQWKKLLNQWMNEFQVIIIIIDESTIFVIEIVIRYSSVCRVCVLNHHSPIIYLSIKHKMWLSIAEREKKRKKL